MGAQANLDTVCVNTIRTLAMDAVQQADLPPIDWSSS
jgi:hypothetical protein